MILLSLLLVETSVDLYSRFEKSFFLHNGEKSVPVFLIEEGNANIGVLNTYPTSSTALWDIHSNPLNIQLHNEQSNSRQIVHLVWIFVDQH